jgi:hypothetical protein
MKDRTLEPAEIISVENDPARLVKEGDQIRHDVLLIVSPRTKDRMVKGWVCAYCTEPLAEAFPEECNFCRFPVRELQTEYISRRYVGDVRIGSKIKVADEVDRLDELVAYEQRTGIALPDSVWNGKGEI